MGDCDSKLGSQTRTNDAYNYYLLDYDANPYYFRHGWIYHFPSYRF